LTLSKIEHLSKEDIIKNGSIFTPQHIVKIAEKWLSDKINDNDFIIDFGVGYGAFISEFLNYSNNLIATDIDESSIKLVSSLFPKVKVILENSLIDISRSKYGINESDTIIIIGNPPYNDLTSQYKKGQKGNLEIDDSIRARDLGISFLKMYALLQPEYICILHPLSYLIKKTNFNSLNSFKDHYILEKGIIFSSNEFESIKKSNAEFPVVLSLYKKSKSKIMDFEYIENFTFEILSSNETFCLKNFTTIDGHIKKYPTKELKKDEDLKFYTIRDINALKRNKSFLTGFSNNGIKISINELYQYAWLDYFKNNFNPDKSFIYGNLSPLYSDKIENDLIKKELISYVMINNDVVKKYILENNLLDELKKIYRIDDFKNEFPKLKEILDSLN